MVGWGNLIFELKEYEAIQDGITYHKPKHDIAPSPQSPGVRRCLRTDPAVVLLVGKNVVQEIFDLSL